MNCVRVGEGCDEGGRSGVNIDGYVFGMIYNIVLFL